MGSLRGIRKAMTKRKDSAPRSLVTLTSSNLSIKDRLYRSLNKVKRDSLVSSRSSSTRLSRSCGRRSISRPLRRSWIINSSSAQISIVVARFSVEAIILLSTTLWLLVDSDATVYTVSKSDYKLRKESSRRSKKNYEVQNGNEALSFMVMVHSESKQGLPSISLASLWIT